MDETTENNTSKLPTPVTALQGLLSGGRQLFYLVGIAAAIALLVVIFLWAQRPSYSSLFNNLAEKDAGQIMEALQKAAVPYRVDPLTGSIQVAANQVHEARIKLAAQGLPKGAGVGFELLEGQNGFGTSQFMESARFHRALEVELARSIATLEGVERARVHLAMGEQSVFIRDRRPPSASVLVQLYPGREMDKGQIAAIVHLVASSVPRLPASRVTVVDQSGRLLTQDETSDSLALSLDQLEYTKRVENSYIKRIEDILSPLVGREGVRAQVTADIDFTVTERTEEQFDQSQPAVRSEQLVEERSPDGGAPQGIPGALSNRPPGAVSVPEKVDDAKEPADKSGDSAQRSLRRRETRNYELDKSISHSRLPTGQVRRLSVAVVVDHRVSKDDKGNVVRTPLSEGELSNLEALVKEAVGLDAKRGDTVHVMNASFSADGALAPLPDPPLWEQPWLLEMVKLGIGALLALAVLLLVVRPLLRSLLGRRSDTTVVARDQAKLPQQAGGDTPRGAVPGLPEALPEDSVTLTQQLPGNLLKGTPEYETPLNLAKSLVAQDPSRAVQVIRNWLSDNG